MFLNLYLYMHYKLTFATVCKLGSSIFLMNQKYREVLAESLRDFPQSHMKSTRGTFLLLFSESFTSFPVLSTSDTVTLVFARNSFPWWYDSFNFYFSYLEDLPWSNYEKMFRKGKKRHSSSSSQSSEISTKSKVSWIWYMLCLWKHFSFVTSWQFNSSLALMVGCDFHKMPCSTRRTFYFYYSSDCAMRVKKPYPL